MLLSEIGDKEIVDLTGGVMYGKLWDAEMIFDEASGLIKALVVPDFQGSGRAGGKAGGRGGRFRGEIQLPWSCILVIGEDMIIFKSA